MRWRFALGGALVRALAVYWLVVFPCARRELRRWRRQAEQIGDPHLRAIVLGKLASETLVAEGAAAFAVLAPARHRGPLIRAVVAYELLYDAVDGIGELPVADPLAHNRTVHAALVDAVGPGGPMRDYLRFAPSLTDDAYLPALVAQCRHALRRLPAHAAVLPALERFATRAAEAQSLNHAGLQHGHEPLTRWASAHRAGDERWWEVAAAASDPLGVFALAAAAADGRTDASEVAAIERSYFPGIGALVWLMESLVDLRDDVRSGNHSYVSHYGTPQAAAERLATIAERAAAAACPLRHGATHSVLLAGVTSLYLSAPEAQDEELAVAAAAIRRALGWPVAVLLVVLRLRRRVMRS